MEYKDDPFIILSSLSKASSEKQAKLKGLHHRLHAERIEHQNDNLKPFWAEDIST